MTNAPAVDQVTRSENEKQLAVETDISFTIMGNDKQIFHGLSKTLSTTDLSFDTNILLQKGMLLQMTMSAKESNSPALQTTVEVTEINPLEDESGFHIDSNIKDIAIGM